MIQTRWEEQMRSRDFLLAEFKELKRVSRLGEYSESALFLFRWDDETLTQLCIGRRAYNAGEASSLLRAHCSHNCPSARKARRDKRARNVLAQMRAHKARVRRARV